MVESRPASNIPQPTRNLSRPASNIPQPMRNFPRPASNILQPKRNFSRPASNIPQPKSIFSKPASNIPKPKSNILFRQVVRARLAMFFSCYVSKQSVERDSVSVIGLIVNLDNLKKRRKVRQNHFQADMTKKFARSIDGRLKPQHSTSYACIQRQSIENYIKRWFIESRACKKNIFPD